MSKPRSNSTACAVMGKIGRLGVTNFDVPRLKELIDAGIPVATQQLQYSLVDSPR